MRYFLTLLATFAALAAQAGPPQLFLDVARFRNLNKVEKGADVEIYVTVPTQPLTYRQRAPRSFQSAAVVTLDVLKADGKPAYHEVITLKPPVLTDTTIAIKNPQSFLKKLLLPDGTYTLRGTVRDQYGPAGSAETTMEKPLVLEAPTGPFLSDIVLLARPAVKGGDDAFSRGGYRLTRAPGGRYGRGADNIFFYTELHNAPAGPAALRVHYHLTTPDGSAADADASLTPQSGRPTTVVGQLPMGPLPEGPFTLFIEVYGGPGTKKLLAGHRVIGQHDAADFAPGAAPAAH